jgi:hypothetical protein
MAMPWKKYEHKKEQERARLGSDMNNLKHSVQKGSLASQDNRVTEQVQSSKLGRRQGQGSREAPKH